MVKLIRTNGIKSIKMGSQGYKGSGWLTDSTAGQECHRAVNDNIEFQKKKMIQQHSIQQTWIRKCIGISGIRAKPMIGLWVDRVVRITLAQRGLSIWLHFGWHDDHLESKSSQQVRKQWLFGNKRFLLQIYKKNQKKLKS